jgi:integrase
VAHLDPKPETVSADYAGPWRIRWRFGGTRAGRGMSFTVTHLWEARSYRDLIVNTGQRDKPTRDQMIAVGLGHLTTEDPAAPVLDYPAQLASYADVHQAARSLLGSVGRAHLTVEQVVICYLDHLAASEDAPRRSTLDDYLGYLRNHIIGTEFGRLPLSAATGADAQAWQKAMRTKPKLSRGAGTVGASTVIKVRQAVMGPAMRWATLPDLAGRPAIRPDNVFTHVRYPKAAEPQIDVVDTVEGAEEIQALAEQVSPEFGELVRLTLNTGERWMEVSAVECRDLTAERFPALVVRRSKTDAGRRVVPLHPAYFDRLVMVAGDRAPGARLLLNEHGQPWTYSTTLNRWKQLTDRYNDRHPASPKKWRGHSLRHTFVSTLAADGAVASDVIDLVTGHTGKRSRKAYLKLTPAGASTVATRMGAFTGAAS